MSRFCQMRVLLISDLKVMLAGEKKEKGEQPVSLVN
jgi:hypothetical protein